MQPGSRMALRLIGLGFLLLIVGLAAFTQWKSAEIAARFPPTGQFVDVDGGRLHYTQRAAVGRERGTVVLIHGASGSQADMMIPLGDRLAALGFKVVAFDRPGHGWSDRPDGRRDASPARQAQLIRQGAEHLGIHQAIVVAHSLAGVLATNLAIEQLDFTAGLVLVAPVTHPWPGGVALYYTLAATPVADEIFTRLLSLPIGLAAIPAGVDGVFAPNTPPPDYAEQTGVQLLLRPSEFMANSEDVNVLHDFVTRQAPRLHEIKAPTAIVTGDSDGVVLTHIHSDGSARDIPGATLKVLPGVGHSAHWVDPQAVVDAVAQVADRVGEKALVGAR